MSSLISPEILHHGAINGVTGSCHQLLIDEDNSLLVDCGLFQGAERSPGGSSFEQLAIEFPIDSVKALLITHCHIDHVGRIPYLLAASFSGPIFCSEPTAVLLPLVLEDAVKVGFSKDKDLLEKFLRLLKKKIIAVPYGRWQSLELSQSSRFSAKIRFSPAGHILGSAYIECELKKPLTELRVTFSGDLGAAHTPLLPAPKSPYRSDLLVLESTYGDKNHDDRKHRKAQLKRLVHRCFQNKGVILIPAFSIGRTQELLYELEEIIFQNPKQLVHGDSTWEDLEVIVDSPLASRFTRAYRKLKPFWDAEARTKLLHGRHPLSFEQLTTIDSHQDHLSAVDYLQKKANPCIVIAASGMCAGGRIVNYLKALIEDERTDILLVGYQAVGTPGRDIQKYADQHGYVELDHRRYTINAGVYTLNGYSAHADQDTLLRFVNRIKVKPKEIRLVHGDEHAKSELQRRLHRLHPGIQVRIAE